jgi:hypothetical protein
MSSVPAQTLRLSATGAFFALPGSMTFATLLPQIRTDRRRIKLTGDIDHTVGFSTTMTVLANRPRTIHSRLKLPKQSAVAQNALERKIEAMDL